MKELRGDLIAYLKEGYFDIAIQGCNCFNTMSSGLAKHVRNHLPEAWEADQKTKIGDINKLGNYTFADLKVDGTNRACKFINVYSQYTFDKSIKPLDYEALTLALRKINHNFKGKTIGVPQIGAGLAGGDWNKIKKIIEIELKDMNIIFVYFS